jgi:hypothetical protein
MVLCGTATLGMAAPSPARAEPATHEGHAGATAPVAGSPESGSADHSIGHSSPAASQEDPHAGHGTVTPIRGGITREEEKAYSLFMHRSCGLALITLGVLILADRLTQRRHGAIRKGMGAVWLLMGIHVFINADPTDWPIAASFKESWARAGSGEWLQHKVLALIPMALGLYAIVKPRRQMELKPSQGFALAAIMALGGIGLLIHEHQHSPGMDMALIEKEHNLMALTSFVIAAGSASEGLQRVAWKAKLYLLPVGLIVLGLQLAAYTE